jgi:hypothetical protein
MASFFENLSNIFSSNQEKNELNRESNAINELNRVVADYQQIKPDRDRAKVNATQLRIILDRQTDKAKASDIQHLEDKEIKQFERKVTRQLWDLKRILYNLNIIIRTEYHEMLLEVHKPLQSYSLLLEEFEKIFLKHKEAGIVLGDKQKETIRKYFELIKNDYNTLVTMMVSLTKYELSPISLANTTVTAQHMKERSDLRRQVNQTTISIRSKFLAITRELKKVKLDSKNMASTNPSALDSNNQILITCLDNAKYQFEGLITLFSQRGKLAKEMVNNAEIMRTNTLREIIELKAVLDQFYLEMRSKTNNTITPEQNKILAQLQNWEEKNKKELDKDAYILAEEEQDEVKAVAQTQGTMLSMRDDSVNKTNAIIATITGLTAGAVGAVVASNLNNGNTSRDRGMNITNNTGSNVSGVSGMIPVGSNVPTNSDIRNNPTNLLNKNGPATNDSMIHSEQYASAKSAKSGTVLDWFRKKWITLTMAGVFAFNIAGPTVINYAQVRNAPAVVQTIKSASSDYYEEDITINISNKTSRSNFSRLFDNKEGMQSKQDFEKEVIKQIISSINGEKDSVAKNMFNGEQTEYSVVFHPEKSLITGTTCPSGTTIGYTQTNNNNGLGFSRASEADNIVEKIVHQMATDSTLVLASNNKIPLKSAIIYNDNSVESAAINLNRYAQSINRLDLLINIKQLRQGNFDEVKKFDICLRLMKVADLARYEKEVKYEMNPVRGADVQLAFTLMLKKVSEPVTPAPIPILPVADTPIRKIREEDLEFTNVVKPKYKKPSNEKITPQDWRNVRTSSGGQTRVRPGNTSFITGRQGNRQTQQRKTTPSRNKNRY